MLLALDERFSIFDGQDLHCPAESLKSLAERRAGAFKLGCAPGMSGVVKQSQYACDQSRELAGNP